MTQYLCNIKMSATNCITKKYGVPFLEISSQRQDRSKIYESTKNIQISYFNRVLPLTETTFFTISSERCIN